MQVPVTRGRSLSCLLSHVRCLPPDAGSKGAQRTRRFSEVRRNFFASMEVNSVELAYNQGLVGLRVRVFWPREEDWFQGRITKFKDVPRRGESGTNPKHRIVYEDGTAALLPCTVVGRPHRSCLWCGVHGPSPQVTTTGWCSETKRRGCRWMHVRSS